MRCIAVVPVFLLTFLAGCVTPGASAFRDYRASYEAARTASTQVVEVYNQYDKANRRLRISEASFDPDLADVYSATALTPISIKITEGFSAATIYTEVLGRYLDNDTLSLQEDDIARLNAATTSVATLANAQAIGGQINALVNASKALVNLSLAQSDRDEFIRSVRAGSQVVDDFLAAVRADTTDMYRTARLATAVSNGSTQKLSEFRVMLANWVLLIDQARGDLATLQAQVETGTGGQTALSLLAESAERIDRYAADIAAARNALTGVF
ncbi:MAG: hypothetical protein AAF999_17495 [Pseudomonadota bacterium]